MEPINPANTKMSLEVIQTRWEMALEKCANAQTKDDDKFTHTARSIMAMIFGGKFLTIS